MQLRNSLKAFRPRGILGCTDRVTLNTLQVALVFVEEFPLGRHDRYTCFCHMRKQMLRILIRKGQMKSSSRQSWTEGRLLFSVLNLPNLFSSQQPSWHLTQIMLFLCSKALNGTLPHWGCLLWLARPWPVHNCAPPSWPVCIFVALSSSPSNLSLIHLAPDIHLLSLPGMVPEYSHGLFLHLCSVFPLGPLSGGSFPCDIPHPFLPLFSPWPCILYSTSLLYFNHGTDY